MAKNKIKPIKLILTGFLWAIIYICIFLPIIGYFLNFDFLSSEAWSHKYQDFFNYKWRINTLFDTLLLFMMILWIPLGFIGWYLFYHLNWEKLKPSFRLKKAPAKAFELKENNKPIYHMPRKMPSTIQVTRYVAPKLPNQKEEIVSGEKSHTNLAQIIKQTATLARKYKVEIFQHILLEGFRVPMAISTDARAVLIEIVNRKKVNWSVEFSDDVTAGGWYSEGGVMERLAQELIGASKSLAKSEPNSEVLSAILVTDGRILNAKQAVEYFRSKGIFLLGYNNAEPKDELPDLASFLSAYFDLKDGETDPAPHPVEKVPLKSQQTATRQIHQEKTAEKTTSAQSAQTQTDTQTNTFDKEIEQIRESLSEIKDTASQPATENVQENISDHPHQPQEVQTQQTASSTITGRRAPDIPIQKPASTEE